MQGVLIMPYCTYLYNGLTIDSNTEVRPCCHIKDTDIQKYLSDFDFTVDTNYPDIVEAMKTGWHPACNECYNAENDITVREEYRDSPRTRANKKYSDLPAGKYNLVNFKTSNTCNLACVMCGPGSSSAWLQIVKNNLHLGEDYPNLSQDDNGKYSWPVTDEIINMLDQVELFKFTGGEPFLIKDNKRACLEIMKRRGGDVSDITLHIDTNGNVTLDDEWFDILNSFNTLISVSVDGVGSRYEYIRPGGSWSYLNEFIQILQERFNGEIVISPVAQALNYVQQDELREWAKGYGLNAHPSEILYDPYFLNNSAVHPRIREKMGFHTIHDWEPENFEKMKVYLAKLDKIHGTDFRTECPEFFDDFDE